MYVHVPHKMLSNKLNRQKFQETSYIYKIETLYSLITKTLFFERTNKKLYIRELLCLFKN